MLAIRTIWLDGWWHYQIFDHGRMVYEALSKEGDGPTLEEVMRDHDRARNLGESHGTVSETPYGKDLRSREGTS